MEPIHEPQPLLSEASPGDLIVQNGRLAGTRRPLNVPVTFVGRDASCDIRLNVDGVAPLHCLLVFGPNGLALRHLHGDSGTLVNGERVNAAPLRDGDLLTVGPFQFRLALRPGALPPAPPVATPPAESSSQEKEALRIQAAAVAAQQAALGEEEARLVQKRGALQQQEEQLASHLEEKRRKLLNLHEQAQAARAALQNEQKTFAVQVGQSARDFARKQEELQEGKQQVEADRRRLADLRVRLKRRWHRHWQAERLALRKREAELAAERRQWEKQGERLQQERAALTQARLRFNGESELGRRQLEADRQQLRQEQQLWQEQRGREQAELTRRARELDRRAAEVADTARRLADEQHHWQKARLHLEKEAEGLENRVRNYRGKVLEQEQEIARLGAVLNDLQQRYAAAAHPPAALPAPTADVPCPAVESQDNPALVEHEARLRAAEAGLHKRRSSLEALADQLADQRLQLVEEWERLALLENSWRQDHDAAAAELEAAGLRLLAYEQELAARAQALEPQEDILRQRRQELDEQRHHLEAWQARLRTRTAAWEGERDRLLSELHGREAVVEQNLMALLTLRQRWLQRRRQEVTRWQTERAAFAALRQECATLRQNWLKRHTELEQDARQLAEKALSLEQYRQELLGKTDDPVAAARRLQKLRQRCVAQNAAAARRTDRERKALQADLARFEERCLRVQKHVDELAAHEAEFHERRTLWEHEQELAQAEQTRCLHETRSLHAQRDRYEQQVAELQDEIERIVRLLLDDAANEAASVSQAA
jgi:hypothetical protein